MAAWASWQCALRVAPDDPAAVRALAALEASPELPASARAVCRFRAPGDDAQRTRWNDRFQGRDLGDLDTAAAAFAALIDDDPDDAAAQFNWALCMAWLGHNAEAVTGFNRAGKRGAAADFVGAIAAYKRAEIVRHGAGAEHRADDLRFSWALDWDEDDTDRLLRQVATLRPVPVPIDPAVAPQPIAPRIFEWLDRPMPDTIAAVRSADDLPRVLAMLVIAPRSLRLSSPLFDTLGPVARLLLDAIGDPDRAIEREVTPLPLSLLDANVWTFRLPPDVDAETGGRLTREAVERFYEDTWIHLTRQGLGGRTPLQASRALRSGHPDLRARLAAIVAIREELGARSRAAAIYQGYPFDRLRRRLGLEPDRPEAVDPDDPSCMSEQELESLDPAGLDEHRLIDAYQSALALRARDDGLSASFASIAAQFAAELVRRDAPSLARLDLPALFELLVGATDRGLALDWIAAARRLDPAHRDRYDLWAVETLASSGRPDEALAVCRTVAERPAELLVKASEILLEYDHPAQATSLLLDARERARSAGDDAAAARIDRLLEQTP